METLPKLLAFFRRIHWSPITSTNKWPVMGNFDIYFDVAVYKVLNTPTIIRWFQTLCRLMDIILMV